LYELLIGTVPFDTATLRNAGLVPRADLEELKRRRNVCGKPLSPNSRDESKT